MYERQRMGLTEARQSPRWCLSTYSQRGGCDAGRVRFGQRPTADGAVETCSALSYSRTDLHAQIQSLPGSGIRT